MLRGTLDSFSAGELLWLIGRSQATGTLRVGGSSSGAIWCRDGFVTWAAVGEDADVLDLLATVGVVAPGADPTAAADQVEAELRSGPSAQRIHDLVRNATEEAVFEMAGWEVGDLAFDVGPAHRFAQTFCYPVVNVLEAVRRRRARWGDLLAAIGGVDRVIVQAMGGSDDDVTLSRAQWRLVAAVDGRTDVTELARSTGLGLFGTAELVAGLIDAGIVAAVDPGTVAAGRHSALDPFVADPPRSRGRHLAAVPSAAGESGPAGSAIATVDDPDVELQALVRELGLPDADFVGSGDGKPSRDLIIRLLAAVKEM